jgi:hypothetical protein
VIMSYWKKSTGAQECFSRPQDLNRTVALKVISLGQWATKRMEALSP